jgi:hypothetical protein
MSHGWYQSRSAWPMPPKNTTAISPFNKGEIDVRWDNPALLHGNEGWLIKGVNIYRSGSSDRGPYRRVNVVPIGGTLYRDRIDTWMVYEEEIQPYQWISKGAQGEEPYRFNTKYPIARLNSISDPADSPKDVIVTIDNQIVPISRVFGELGEVVLLYQAYAQPNAITRGEDNLPEITDTSVVKVSYLAYDSSSRLRVGVDKRDFYRVATVAEDPLTKKLHETPLEHCPPFSDREIEQVDYMWREGIRRNNWILEQGGERVKLFTRRVVGEPCFCTAFNPETLIYGKQPDSLCKVCFGVGIKGGYDGPYDIIVGPDEGDKRISQEDRGRRKEHSYEVWIGPSPLVSQRDFIVKMNNDRYSVGGVRYPSNRGNILQQHFNIAYLDSGDIRYKFPIEGVPVYWAKTQYGYWPQRDTYTARSDSQYSITSDTAYPMGSDKAGVSNSLEKSGRTATWENQNY